MTDEFTGQQLGKYKILSELGRGGMAVVYKAEDEALGRVVALKVLNQSACSDPGATTRFEREAQVTARLNHPNIIKIFDIGRTGGSVYFAMEFLPHASLHDIIKREGKFSIDRAIEICQEVLRGLQCAHTAGVVHRDIKPENIMLNEEGHVVLVDFGIAKTQKGARLTQTGILLGTPYYMSPEQITGKEIKHTSDIYSTGVVLYELLTANVPFQADSTFMISYMHCTQEPPDPREFNKEVSEDLKKVIRKAMAKDPMKRYASAEEMHQELARVSSGDVVEAEEQEELEVEAHPEFAKALACYRAKDFEGASRHFEAVTKDAVPVEYAALAQRWVGSCYYDLELFPEAIVEFKRVIDKWPETDEAKRIPVFIDGCCFQQLARGENLYTAGKLKEAKKELSAIINVLTEHEIPLDNNLWSQHAQTKVKQIDDDLARRRFYRLSAIVSGAAILTAICALFLYFYWINPFARYSWLASIHSARKNYIAEQIALKEALILAPKDGRILFRLARSQILGGGPPVKAMEVLQEAVNSEPNLAPAYELLGDLHGQEEQWQEAETNLLAAKKHAPPTARLLSNLGLVKERLGAAQEAIKLYKQALQLDPGYAMAYNNLGVHYLNKKEYEFAARSLRQAIRADGQLAEGHHNLGKTFFSQALALEKKKNISKEEQENINALIAKSFQCFDKALIINPELPDALYHKALVAIRRDERDTARDALRQAIDLDPTNGRMRFEYAQLLLKDNDTRSAETHLKAAVDVEPENILFRQALASHYMRLRLWDAAESQFKALIKLVPQNADIYKRLGFVLKRRMRYAEAQKMLTQAATLAPQRADVLGELGEVLHLQGLHEPARQLLVKVATMAPKETQYLMILGDVLMAQKKWAEGERLFAALSGAASGDGKRTALYKQGRCLIEQQRFRSAETAFRRALGSELRHVPSLNELGMLLASLGRRNEAIAMLKRSLEVEGYQQDAAKVRDMLQRLEASQ